MPGTLPGGEYNEDFAELDSSGFPQATPGAALAPWGAGTAGNSWWNLGQEGATTKKAFSPSGGVTRAVLGADGQPMLELPGDWTAGGDVTDKGDGYGGFGQAIEFLGKAAGMYGGLNMLAGGATSGFAGEVNNGIDFTPDMGGSGFDPALAGGDYGGIDFPVSGSAGPGYMDGASSALTEGFSGGLGAPVTELGKAFTGFGGGAGVGSEVMGLLKQVLGGGGGGSGGLSMMSSLVNAGTGLYGLYQSEQQKKLAKLAAMRSDPWGTSGGRDLAAGQLKGVLEGGSAAYENTPAYRARMQAVQRSMAANGYLGSGNMAVAAANAGTAGYNEYLQQMSGLAGANANPATASTLEMTGTSGANNLAMNSLGLIGKGIGYNQGSSITDILQLAKMMMAQGG